MGEIYNVRSRTTLITGATGGVGHVVGQKLAAVAHRLVLTARTRYLIASDFERASRY
jgi:short-subunit dehydrogenase